MCWSFANIGNVSLKSLTTTYTVFSTTKYVKSSCTQPPESWHHVDECGDALTVGLRQVSFEMVAQSEQVMRQVHAVVVLYSCQMWELEQIFPGRQTRFRKKNV